MAKITNIEIRPLLGNPQYNNRVFVSTEGFDAKRHRIILRVDQKFYDELRSFFIKDLYINPENTNATHPLSLHMPDMSSYLSVYAQLYDYKSNEIKSTKRQDFKKSLLTWQKDEGLVSVSEGNFNVFWNTKRRVVKVEGPFDKEGNPQTEVKPGERYYFRAEPHQNLSETQMLSVKWAYKYDDGDITPFQNHNESIEDGLNVMDCSFHATPKNIKVYAYFLDPSEKVMVEFSNFGENEENPTEEEKPDEINKDKFIITEEFLDEFMSKTGHGTISKVSPYNKRITAYIDYLNLYMEKFGIKDSNQRMAHFLGQIAKETKFWSYNEDFIFGKGKLKENFKNFKTEESKPYAEKWEYKTNSKSITKEIQIQIANYAYARPTKALDFNNTICDLNNLKDPKQDGYNYRGRGLIQITGRNNYGEFQAWYNKHQKELELEKIDFLKNPNKVLEPINVVLSAIYFWDKNNLNTLADKGIEEKHILAISNVINSGEDDDKKKIRKDYVKKAFECLKNLKEDKTKESSSDEKNVEGNPSKPCPEDKSQCFNYEDVVSNPRINNQSNNVNKNRFHREKRYNSTHPKGYYHTGVDILAKTGSNVYSLLCGEVFDYYNDCYTNQYIENSLGNWIIIKSKDKEGKDVYIKYCHLDKVLIKKGKVKHGDNIALSGSTGNAASVYKNGKLIHGIDPKYRHIHIEASRSSSFGKNRIDPEQFMKTRFDETTKGGYIKK